MSCHNIHLTRTRREFLQQAGAGFGALALTHLLQSRSAAAAPVLPQRPARARSVIFLFMEGGPSHIDLFDPKPELNRLAGQKIPDSFRRVITAMGEFHSPLLASQRTFKQHGQSGLWVSDWLPKIAECADDLAVIRSCWADGINHSSGVCQMNTGSTLAGRPSLGSWVSYGLGTENADLPAFVVMQDQPAPVINGPRNWGAGFMPALHQGVRLTSGPEPIPNLNSPAAISSDRQEKRLAFLHRLNRSYADAHPGQSELEARIASYELAYRMQATAPNAVDLTQETDATKKLYGLDDKTTETFGRMCLHARRLVERGTRFVQLYSGAGSKWDSHTKMEENHSALCRSIDHPIAGLLRDLKARGLLDSTLVVWGGEFGRTPQSEKGDGRDHNPTGFTMWMAGGGVKGGQTIGSTDELGLHAVEDRLHVHDLHATILEALGLDNMDLIYKYKGRPERPTLNEGAPCLKLFA
jgi:Protein of unknown function (DUF1501)